MQIRQRITETGTAQVDDTLGAGVDCITKKYAADMTFGQVQWGVDVGWLSYGLIKISLRLLGI